MRVGFIGLGAMGEPMARILASTDFLYAVWGRNTEFAKTWHQSLMCVTKNRLPHSLKTVM